ncbi:MAG: hypothetical protein V4473_02035 [Patescibacteria group bacterium]
MEMHPTIFNFNKEIIFGESGAFIFVNVGVPIISHFTRNPTYIAFSAVGSTLLGGSIFWLAARIYDRENNSKINIKKIASDIGYFTPAAIILGLIIYDPSIYFLTHYLLTHEYQTQVSVLIAQVVSFFLFLIFMNIYRHLLYKIRGKYL